jgi:hypothetical protein
MDYINKLKSIDWNKLDNKNKEELQNILIDLTVNINQNNDRNELLWLLRLLSHQYLNGKRHYIYPLYHDIYNLTQNDPFLPFKLDQNIISRHNKTEECKLYDNVSI